VRPSGYKVNLEQPPGHKAWHIVGTVAEGTLCHKPCTVSGGGKSEISKAISDAILPGPVFVADFERDMDRVEELINRDYSDRFRDPAKRGGDQRPILSPERSLGSVIKLLTPADREYADEYNAWLRSIPQYIREIVFVVKRHFRADWDGGPLARALLRRHPERQPGQRAQVRQPQARGELPARGLRRRRGVAGVRPARGLPPGGEGPDGGRHHGLGRRAGRGARSGAGPSFPGASSSSRTANGSCSSARTTPSTAATTS
jgi:hypothetical protein